MEHENELILHMLTITFSKPLCENGPGTLHHMLNSRLSASRIKMGRSEIHPHSSTHLSCLWMHSGFVCLAPISPVSTRSAPDDDQGDGDLWFSTCMVSLRHCTMMNSLSSHCTVLEHIFQSQISQTEI